MMKVSDQKLNEKIFAQNRSCLFERLAWRLPNDCIRRVCVVQALLEGRRGGQGTSLFGNGNDNNCDLDSKKYDQL